MTLSSRVQEARSDYKGLEHLELLPSAVAIIAIITIIVIITTIIITIIMIITIVIMTCIFLPPSTRRLSGPCSRSQWPGPRSALASPTGKT